MRIEELGDRRVAIWGYGREGRAVHRALRSCHPRLPLTIFAPGQDPSEHDLATDTRVTLHGREPGEEDLGGIDVLIKSPGVSAYSAIVRRAEELGVEVSSGVALWFAGNPDARTLIISGTKGKSTTAAACAHLLRACGLRVALAGNIGVPLMDLYRPRPAPDWWVIELSSYQTRELPRAANISVLLNLYPEHLDWHGDLETYYRDKLKLLHVAGEGLRLVNDADEELRQRTEGLAQCQPFNTESGWHPGPNGLMRGDVLRVPADAITLRGAHNAVNLCAALAAVEACGVDMQRACAAVSSFRGLPHRLQRLGWRDGLLWVNDSISTVPEASLAALASVPGQPAVLILGGYDRGLAWKRFAEVLDCSRLRGVVVQGQNREVIASALSTCPGIQLKRAEDLEGAVQIARQFAQLGDAVLLSPGAPSFPAYRDYTARGQHFSELAGFPGQASTAIDGLGIVD